MTTKRNRPILFLILCGALLIAAIAAGTAFMVNDFRNRAVEDATRELKNTSLILAEQIDRSLQALQLVQESIKEQILSQDATTREEYDRAASTYDIHLLLKHKIAGLAHVDALTLIDSNGKLLNFSRRWPIPDVNVADRDYFQVLKTNAKLSSFVSAPVRNRGTDTWTVYLARKLTSPNGEFLGLILGAIELQYFERYFGSLELGDDSAIAVFRRDGTLLVRYPRIESMIGRNFIEGPLFKRLMARADHGTLRLDSRIDGQDRLVAARSLKNFPIVIVAATTTAAALSSWKEQTRFTIGAAALSALVIGMILFLIIRQVLREQRAATRTLALEKQRLDTAINNMSQGLLLFDSEGRIVFHNRQYVEMYGLSADVVKPGCSFRNLIQHRKDTGTFSGDIDAYCAAIANSLGEGKIAERLVETPDGRSIRILNLPVPSGGWVATHEDVTERERLTQAQNEADRQLREKSLQLDAALNNMSQGLCMFDAEQRIVLFNQRFVAMVHFSPEELAGRSLLDLFQQQKARGEFPGDPRQFLDEIIAGMRGGRSATKIVEIGNKRTLRVVDEPMEDGGWVATFEDITEQRRVEQERDRDREFLNQIINNVPAAIVVKNAHDRRYVLINQAAEEHFGAPRDRIVGKTADEVWSKPVADLIDSHDEALFESGGYLIIDEHSVDTPARGERFITAKRLIIRDGKGDPQYLLGVLEDVTERRRANERIVHLAHYDSLTDLPNRVLFREHLEQSLKWIRRGECLAVLYLDIDEFKSVNDALGHPVGDELLKAVAARLRACIRETDIVSRLGGDEFAIIQTAVEQPSDVIDLASRIHDAVGEPLSVAGHRIVTGTSIGIAMAPHDGTNPDELLRNADLAMYGAKAEGRGAYRFFEPDMNARVKARRELEFDLREAIISGGFEMYYQPLVDLRDNSVGCCEALLRWRHPRRGPISPVEFIPLAEDTGLITQLGEWALRTACRQAAAWPDNVKVAVNVSPIQFKSGNIVQVVINALAASRLPARRLELEITEAVLIRDDATVLAVLHQLRSLGIRVAMDDFGTGYSSLSYLQRFPFDKIKIDRCFIKDIDEPEGSLSIVQAVISIAKSRNITTTAEGVETESQLEVLRALGCTEIQGYLFSPPRSPTEIPRFIESLGERTVAVA